MTAIDTMGRGTPILDPEVFYDKSWSKIFFLLHWILIVLKIWHFTSIMNSCQIGEVTRNVCSQYSPPYVITLWVSFGAKSLNGSWYQTRWYGWTNFDWSLSQSDFQMLLWYLMSMNISIHFIEWHNTYEPSGGRLHKKDGLTRYGDSHVKDKTS